MFIAGPPLSRTTMNRAAESAPEFTQKQGQYLAFIDAYTLVNGRPPAQADLGTLAPSKVGFVSHQNLRLLISSASSASRRQPSIRCC
jgi:hypothetical protein